MKHGVYCIYVAILTFLPTCSALVSELLKRHFVQLDCVSDKDLTLDRYFLAGAAAGLCYWVTTYPLDVIKARMQCASLGSRVTWLGTARQLCASPAGWRAFTTGIVPCAARAIPACSMMFTTVDLVRNSFN
ncbi:solute carrier family 25 protein [archaeon]|nr:MAG: solute carrier family 25 protein [archaeon]